MDGLEQVVGAEVQESTEPATQEVTEPVNNAEGATEGTEAQASETAETTEAPQAERDVQRDALFASVRRKAEADAAAKYGAETQRLNERIKALCNGLSDENGRPIETIADYVAALERQKQNERDEELRAKGVDPRMIEDMVNNSPVVRQATEVTRQIVEAEAKRQFETDLKLVGEIDPSIKTEEDLMKHPSYPQVYDYVSKNGLNLPDAFRLANFAEISAKKTAAVKQAAINQAKGKDHLESTGTGVATDDKLVEVPASTMTEYRKFYPDLTEQQIKVKYNEFLNNK